MKLHALPLLALGFLAAGTTVPAYAELVLPRISQKSTLMQSVGITDLTVSYSRPGVKGRPIWGTLVPYDKPWRTGANEATTFTTTDNITVAGKPLAAGTYSFFTIPTANEWTVIFSTQKDLWGSTEYDPKTDALRVTVKPVAAEPVEWMRFTFDNLTPQSTDLVLRWEKTQVTVPIAVDVNTITLAKARTEIAAAKPDDWRTPYRAAQYTFEQGVAMDEGAKWLAQSLAIEKAYSNQALKARWLAKEGKQKEAAETGKQALVLGKAAKTPPFDLATLETQVAEWDGKKN